MSERTDNGFRIGAIEVSALAEWRTGAAVGIHAGRTSFEVQSSRKGQNVVIVMPEDENGQVTVQAPNGDIVRVSWSRRYGGFVVAYRDGRYLHGFDLDEPT